MQISGSNTFTQLRQLGASNRNSDNTVRGQAEQRLTFVFPMIVDSAVSRFANLCRDFLAVEVISHVKVSNVLNITTQITRIGQMGSVSNVNPAQEIVKSMGSLGYGQYTQEPPYNYIQDPRVVQDTINNYIGFIRNQLHHDPRYNSLRPMISSITIEDNLIRVPLIVGTKQFPLPSTMLYYVLVGAVLNNSSDMSDSQGITRIIDTLKNLPDEKFAFLMFSQEGRKRLDDAVGIRNKNITNDPLKKPKSIYQPKIIGPVAHTVGRPILHPIQTSLTVGRGVKTAALATNEFRKHPVQSTKNAVNNAAYATNDRMGYSIEEIQRIAKHVKGDLDQVKIIFGLVTNYQKWAADTNHVQNDQYVLNTVTTIDETPEQRKAYLSASKAFSTYSSLILRPFILSIEKLLGPMPNDISEKSRTLLGFFNNTILDDFWTLLQHTRSQVTFSETTLSQNERIENFDRILERFQVICQNNAKPEFIHSVKTLLFDQLLPDLEVGVNFTGEHLVRFVDKITAAGNQCEAYMQGIKKEYAGVLPNFRDFDVTFNSVRQSMSNEIVRFLYGQPGPIFDRTGDIAAFCDRHQYWFTYICNSRENEECRNFAVKTINTIHESMVSILSFLFIWTFTAYLCEFLNELQLDISLKRKDITEFPNYCLVLPMYVIKNLYIIMTTRNLRNAVFGGEEIKHQDGDVLVDFGNTKRVIELVNKQLRVPNLIVIDEKNEDFYYLLMHMDKPIKTKLATIKSYVEHQQDVLQGF